MIKIRDTRYCNVKLLLIFLVIFGHLIEPQIWENDRLRTLYCWIYLVHMPLFSFLSGLFINSSRSCVMHLKRLVPIYLIAQLTAVLFGNGTVDPITPYWHLWYLVSCSCWTCMAWIWFRYAGNRGKLAILICSLLAGCFAGYIDIIGRTFSLSRTIVFFPYFWMGVICDSSFDWKKYRAAGIAALLISMLTMHFAGDELNVTFLYQAEPFGIIKNGSFLRLLCYLVGTLSGFFLLTFAPTKRYYFTKAGANTLPAYILHAPAVIILRKAKWPGWIYPAVSALLLWLIYKLFQWHGNMYGIAVPERRNRRWPHFRKYMKSTEEKYMVSSCPYPEAKT